jgi:hypothetical protein
MFRLIQKREATEAGGAGDGTVQKKKVSAELQKTLDLFDSATAHDHEEMEERHQQELVKLDR